MVNVNQVFDELGVLKLADSIVEDEFGEITYIFQMRVGEIQLTHNQNDNDIYLKVGSNIQKHPIVELVLRNCTIVSANEDKRGRFIELWGLPEVVGLTRGEITKKCGYRLWLETDVTIELLVE